MKRSNVFLILLIVLTVFPIIGIQGQDLFFSIAGESAPFKSGDSRHQYDFWIKPEADANRASLQIYDAGINGDVDQITTTNANTTTTFRLYNFDDLYRIQNNRVIHKENDLPARDTLIARGENYFKKRWENFSNLKPDTENGYIVRVSTDNGSDVNNYNLRVINESGNKLNNKSWKIIAIDLSMGVFNLPPEQTVQVKPYISSTQLPNLQIAGKEDSKVEFVDVFGNYFSTDTASGISLQDKFGIENTWALNVSGSKEILNNITVYGNDFPQLWLLESAITETQKPEFEISSTTSGTCTDKTFRLNSNVFTQRQMEDAEWILNGETLDTGFSPTISFTARGNQTLHVLIPNPNPSILPNYWVTNSNINISTPPIARLSSPKTVIAPNETITLSAKDSYDLNGQDLSYTWFVNGRPSGNEPEFDFSSSEKGNHIISVRVSNGGEITGCNNRQRQIRIRVNSQPYAEIEYDSTFHIGQYLSFTVKNENDPDNDSLSFRWDGLGVVSNENTNREVIISHLATGTFKITLTADDNTNTSNGQYTVTKTYTVLPPPINAVKPTAADSITSDTTNNQLDSEKDLKPLESDIATTVPPVKPQLSIKAPQLTSDATVDFTLIDSLITTKKLKTDSATIIWDFGDGTVAEGIESRHTYTEPGTYAVNVTINQGENVDQKRHIIVINEYPIADFELPDTLATKFDFEVDGRLSKDNDGFITSYQWYIDGRPVSQDPVATLRIDEPGIHTISLRVLDNSGHEKAQGLISKKVWLNHAPVPRWEITPDKKAPGSEVTFDASKSYDTDGEITKFSWTFDDGTTQEGPVVTKKFTEIGPQYFTLALTDNNGVENSTFKKQGFVNINHPPYIITDNVVHSNTLNVELDATETYDVDNDQVFFEWVLPDGSTRNEASFKWKAPDFGIHIISLTVHDGLGLVNSSNQETIQVLVNRPVVAVVDSLIETCSGQTVLFNSSKSYDPDGDNFNVKWDFGNGETSEEANPYFIYDAPGIYEARVELTDGISEEQTVATIPVVVGGSPVAKMMVSTNTVCVNRPVFFDGSGSRDPSGALPSLVWDLGDGTTESGPKVEHIYTESGLYPVSLTVVGSGSAQCGNTNQVRTNIQVIEGPNAIFNLQEWATPGETILLDGSPSTADNEITNVHWSIEYVPEGSTDTLSGMQTEYQFNQPGEYLVTLHLGTDASTNCNTASLTKSLKVNAPPVINWTLPETVPAGTDINLNAINSEDPDGFIKEFKWYLNGELISKNSSKIIKMVEPGNHTVVLEVKDNSPSENNRSRMQKTFFANSAPQTWIAAPGKIYINREITLSGGPERDEDGDRLQSQWKINGETIQGSTFTPTEVKNYRITLIQNDGRNVSNSVDSAIVEILPIGPPDIQPEYPSKITLGGKINIGNMQILDTGEWKFKHNGNYPTVWTAEKTGPDSLQLTWFFENRPTATVSYPITVYEPLRFISEADAIKTAEWNPANPYTIIKAPAINRDIHEVSYTWFKDGEEIGNGVRINLPIQEGENRIMVRIKDLYVSQSEPIETNLTVTAEN